MTGETMTGETMTGETMTGETMTEATLTERDLVRFMKLSTLFSKPLPPGLDEMDLVQEACVAYLEAIERYNPLQSFTMRTFAWKRMHGVMLDAIRKASPGTRTQHGWQIDFDDVMQNQDIRIADGVPQTEAKIDGERLYAQLTDDRDRAIIEGYYVDDMRMRDIGAHIGMTESGVWRRHQNILASLKHYASAGGA